MHYFLIPIPEIAGMWADNRHGSDGDILNVTEPTFKSHMIKNSS